MRFLRTLNDLSNRTLRVFHVKHRAPSATTPPPLPHPLTLLMTPRRFFTCHCAAALRNHYSLTGSSELSVGEWVMVGGCG